MQRRMGLLSSSTRMLSLTHWTISEAVIPEKA